MQSVYSCETPPKPWLCSTLSAPHTKMALFSPPLPFLFLFLSTFHFFASFELSFAFLYPSFTFPLSASQSVFLSSTFTFSLFLDSGFFPYLPLLLFCLEDHISGLACFILFMLCNCLFSLEENLGDLYRK